MGQEHPAWRANADRRIRTEGRSFSPVFRRVAGVTQSELFDLFDVDVVVETDEVSPLLLLLLGDPRGPGRGGWGAAGLGNGQSAAGAHGHGTALTAALFLSSLCG